MTTLGKTVFAILSVAVLIGGTLALRSKPEPLPRAELTSAQVAELQPAAKPAEPPKATTRCHQPGRRQRRKSPRTRSSKTAADPDQENSTPGGPPANLRAVDRRKFQRVDAPVFAGPLDNRCSGGARPST